MGASVGIGALVSISRNATAVGYGGVSRNYSINAMGVQVSISLNQGSKIPTSIGFGPSYGPGFGIVSQPVQTKAVDTSPKNCK